MKTLAKLSLLVTLALACPVRLFAQEQLRLPDKARQRVVDLVACARGQVRELVEPRLVDAPVIGVTPVLDQLTHILNGRPVLPARPLDLVGEPGRRQSTAQIVEHGVVDADLESLDG